MRIVEAASLITKARSQKLLSNKTVGFPRPVAEYFEAIPREPVGYEEVCGSDGQSRVSVTRVDNLVLQAFVQALEANEYVPARPGSERQLSDLGTYYGAGSLSAREKQKVN
ncbi:hypothetical protein TWF788_003378 [Orbilia oligospora]|uniref:Uncharacterized protein n=1 Tax=Orbilia oligospora TaxID=2813651 RepID=A0A7C8P8V5_ORBOL|nr:hypothetical protein TWF788_003378 [Orbilia oligospora]